MIPIGIFRGCLPQVVCPIALPCHKHRHSIPPTPIQALRAHAVPDREDRNAGRRVFASRERRSARPHDHAQVGKSERTYKSRLG
jgi:hypothetical protein